MPHGTKPIRIKVDQRGLRKRIDSLERERDSAKARSIGLGAIAREALEIARDSFPKDELGNIDILRGGAMETAWNRYLIAKRKLDAVNERATADVKETK